MKSSLLVRLLAALSSFAPRRGKWRVRDLVDHLVRRYGLSIDHTLRVRRLGLIWELNPSDYVQEDLFWHGDRIAKEGRDGELALRFLKPGDTILDVGANFGYHSLTLAHGLAQKCVIHAFEPNPVVFEHLKRHLELNAITCVRPHRLGLGDRKAKVSVECNTGNTGAAFLSPLTSTTSAVSRCAEITTLDEFAEDQALSRLDFIKVDIEGYEYLFLQGGSNTLARLTPPMMMEVCPEHLRRYGHTVDDLFNRLNALGYRQYYVCTGNIIDEFDERLFSEGWSNVNVFCFRQKPVEFPASRMTP